MQGVLAIVAGATILTVMGIMSGGAFLLRLSRGSSGFSPLQLKYFRAGHAHAGVLVILGLTCFSLQSVTAVASMWKWGSVGILASALLIPAGFFLSVLGREVQQPNRLIALIWAGFVVLAGSLLVTGTSVIVAGASQLSS